MQIETVKIDDIIPYKNNPRFNDEAAGVVAKSIEQFGFKVPIIIDKNNVIVTGHTRLKAARLLGMAHIPCIRADDLNEDQINAFRIADNKVAEFSTWDFAKLEIELDKIDLELSNFGIENKPEEINAIPEIDIEPLDGDRSTEDDGGYYGDERERTFNTYNLEALDGLKCTDDYWQMPIIKNDGYIPKRLIGFNYAKTSKDKESGIHFYLDDYQFERLWNNPGKYTDILKDYACILSPDFSLYMDMPMPMKYGMFTGRE